MNITKLLAALVVALLLSLSPARAASLHWTNTLGGNWSDALNWSPNQVPGASDDAFITQAGTYTVTVNVNAALGSLTAGAATGTQTVAVLFGSLSLSSNSIFSSRTVLKMVNGSLTCFGDTTVNGLVEWTGGVIDARGAFNANGGVTISGSVNKGMAGTINNGGTVTWTGSGEILNLGGAVFNNPAGRLFDAQSDATWRFGSCCTLATLNNAGTFRKSAGAGTTRMNLNFNNTGTIEVQSGVVSFQGDGRQNGLLSVSAGATVDFYNGLHTFGAGHTNNIAGTFQISGAVVSAETNVTVTLPNLTLSGVLYGDGHWTVNGPLNWTGGGIYGTGVLNANGGMAISGGSGKVISQRTVNNGGTVTWTGSGYLNLVNGAVFNNPAGRLFDVQTDADLGYTSGGLPTFNNAGIFRKSTGATNEATILGVSLRNTGLVEVLSGNLEFIQDIQFRQTAGATLLKGGNIQMAGPHHLRFAGGLVGGSGKVLLLWPSVNPYEMVVSGQLSPGLSAGRLEILGNYDQRASGSYNVEIGGISPGTNYDQLVVTNHAGLAGTINVVSINGFVPALGDRFEIMKFGSVSGSGSVTFQGLDITNGIYLQPVFSATNLVLVATNAPLRAAPKLNLAHNGDALWLWWPLGYGAFNVQSTTNLNSPIPWSPVTPAELNRHTFQSAEPMKFFRMISP